jgi:hypothetical protein
MYTCIRFVNVKLNTVSMKTQEKVCLDIKSLNKGEDV